VSKLARILFSLALLAVVIGLADWRSVARVLESLHREWLLAAIALALADRLILSYRWQQLLAAQNIDPGFTRAFQVQLVAGFLGTFLPTSLGVDAVRMAALCRAGQPAAPVIGATLVDRASLVVATLVFGSLTILLVAETHVTPALQQGVFICTALVLGALGVMLHPFPRRLARQAITRLAPQTIAEKIAQTAAAALACIGNKPLVARTAVLTAVLFAVRILFVKALLLACGADVPIRALVYTIPALWILVMLPVTIGGLGVQDAGYVALLGLVGVAAPIAVGVSLLEHVISRLISLPGAFLVNHVGRALPGQDAEVSRAVMRSGPRPEGHPALRALKDGAYRARLVRYALRLPDPLRTVDRDVLERIVFNYYAGQPQVRAVLFVGCDWYTRHYGRTYFRTKDYWTLDCEPRARRFGARQHLVAALEDLGEHLPPGYFELIICNGVYGYGLDSREQCERAFAACYRALRAGGHLIVGWDDIPERTPVSLEQIESLARFSRLPFAPLGTWRYVTDTPYRHTYDFYCVPAPVSIRNECSGPLHAAMRPCGSEP
jgi:uncharacterized protein (TIRG00374 family)